MLDYLPNAVFDFTDTGVAPGERAETAALRIGRFPPQYPPQLTLFLRVEANNRVSIDKCSFMKLHCEYEERGP
jgi:hypothetical protein